MDLQDLSKQMRHIDFVMLHTRTDGGVIAGRPMSNNQDVEYDGDSFFFLNQDSRTFADVREDPRVHMSMQGKSGFLGAPPLFISIQGEAEIFVDKAMFEKHWTPDLERWWKDGIDTPGIALMKVHATRIHYWDGEDQGEIIP